MPRPTGRVPRPTGFDKYLEQRLRDPEFRAAYERSRARIDTIDALVRRLDETRLARGWSKAELARRVGLQPAAVRRLLTSRTPNPTMDTFVDLASALGLSIEVVDRSVAVSG